MTPEQERWAEASAVLRWKSDGVHDYVAERLDTLEKDGDAAGVERWQQIAWRIEQLLAATVP